MVVVWMVVPLEREEVGEAEELVDERAFTAKTSGCPSKRCLSYAGSAGMPAMGLIIAYAV